MLAAFFFLNPGLACGPAEAEFQYGATEMRAAIERLLGDAALRQRADELGRVIRGRSGTRHAADLLERLGG